MSTVLYIMGYVLTLLGISLIVYHFVLEERQKDIIIPNTKENFVTINGENKMTGEEFFDRLLYPTRIQDMLDTAKQQNKEAIRISYSKNGVMNVWQCTKVEENESDKNHHDLYILYQSNNNK